MSAPKPAGVLTLVIAMTAGLGGCATVDTWRKCGAGCPGDAEISTAVRARLYQHTELLAPNRVYVSTLDGIVYLSGEVVTDTQRLDAEDIARATPGVTRVVNVISLEFQGW
jgi:osmotically-inducible protein OsmY